MSKRVRVVPGKGQSALGMAVGAMMSLIGLFMAIPVAGLFGLVWTGVAIAITVTCAVNFFSDRGVATHEIVIEEETRGTDRLDTGSSVEQRLRTVDKLYQEGAITAEEREQKRKQILDEI